MKQGLIIFLISSLIAVMANAFDDFHAKTEDECITSNLGSPLGPNRRQGDVGWCYANAAADLITYHYQRELNGARASAGYIALAYSNNYDNGGLSTIAMIKAQLSGFCPMSIEEEVLERGPKVGIKEKINGLRELKKRFDATHGASLNSDLQAQYESTHSILMDIPRNALIEIFTKSTIHTIAKNLADYLCGPHIIRPERFALPIPDSKYVHEGRTATLMATIHEQLSERHNNILSISYFADFFDDEHAANTEKNRHVSVAIGRRWHKNRCEIQIRNSWGDNCEAYKAEFLKEKDMCVKGNLWVPEEILSRAIFGVTYLKK